jgi:tetratricopeptide (TPR) repeat protein
MTGCEPSQQFHEGHDIGLILRRQDEKAASDHVEKQRVVGRDVFERLRRVVVEVRRRSADAAQRRDLERVHAVERAEFLTHAGDERPSRIGADEVRLAAVGIREDEVANRIAEAIEFGDADGLKAGSGRYRERELIRLVFEAHAALVNIKQYYDWDWAGAERECLRLQQIAPGNAVSYQFYGWYLSLMGRFDEGLQQAREAQRLDPMSANIADVIVANRLWAHATDEAILEARRLMELRPGYPAVHSMLAQAYAEQGRFLDAVAELEQSADPPVIKNGLLGQLYGLARRQNDARRMLATLERMHPGGNDPVYQMAQVHLGLGDKDRAIALLEKAYSDRSPWLSWLKVEPSFDALRSDPRFADLLRRIGFK